MASIFDTVSIPTTQLVHHPMSNIASKYASSVNFIHLNELGSDIFI